MNLVSEFGFLPAVNSSRSTLLGVHFGVSFCFYFPRRYFGGYSGKKSLYFESPSFIKEKQVNKNTQALLSDEVLLITSQEMKSNLNPLHKLFFISRETGRLNGKVQQIPKGPLLSKCAQSSVCRTAAETPGPLLHCMVSPFIAGRDTFLCLTEN